MVNKEDQSGGDRRRERGVLDVIADTREQRPWELDPERFRVARGKLPAGDYAPASGVGQFAIERKSLDDLVNTVIHSRKRFDRELEALAGHRQAVVLIEASVDDLIIGRYVSAVDGEAVLALVVSIHVRTGIPFTFCGDRIGAVRVAEKYLRAWGRKIEREAMEDRACRNTHTTEHLSVLTPSVGLPWPPSARSASRPRCSARCCPTGTPTLPARASSVILR